MDKNAIKKYAVWARKEWITRVCQKALQYGITAEDCGDASAENVHGTLLTETERRQRKALIDRIKAQGYEQVMEEVAYTWFNRFSALRFMEVNGYLPSHVRVFTDENGAFKPQILTEAIHLNLDGLDMEKVYALKEADKSDELYKYLLITQCNALSTILPGMFQKIEDYTELLFPDNLLREGSAIQQMIEWIPEEDWEDTVQIIGWLYQYYNSEKKDDVFAALKKNVKITKENIPAATQLFTPDWIVRYMVENSLGRLWLEGHPNDRLKSEWNYYLDEAPQEPEVEAQLAEIRKEYAALKPEDIKCIDPCMGSGHILAYLFDTLMKIYAAYGHSTRESVQSIIEHNLYGLDIDDRAAQLAYFEVMMTAVKYDNRFLKRSVVPQPHVYAIQESNGIQYEKEFGDFLLSEEHRETLRYLLDVFRDAKEYGSILQVEKRDYIGFLEAWKSCAEASIENVMTVGWYKEINERVKVLARLAIVLSQKYDVVVTNPPYMGADGMDISLSNYVRKRYSISKADMYAVFILKCAELKRSSGIQGMITQHSWMFLSSFDKLRNQIISNETITNMCHLGARGFEEISGEVVQTVAWIMQNRICNYRANYVRLIDPTSQDGKEKMFLSGENRVSAKQENYLDIPGMPIAYWISAGFQRIFSEGDKITEFVSSRDGLTTGKNELFIKQFWEVSYRSIGFHCLNAEEFWNSGKKFSPLIKGGLYRKWYGNNWFVITYDKEGYQKLSQSGNKLPSKEVYFLPYITWNRISTRMAFRYCEAGYLFESASLIAFSAEEEKLLYALSFANSVVANSEMQLINPTTNMLSGYVDSLRIPKAENFERCVELAKSCVGLAKIDWNSFETSWDFKKHPLI
ncbi:MAG: BREX-1 system adenine-specific DNA-methyltransferase PglX [Planctomycetia bacterium]|nr:BREX-1 system adenine-specific DNA-methyltransferase PglX [Planctomycetia bacterium]